MTNRKLARAIVEHTKRTVSEAVDGQFALGTVVMSPTDGSADELHVQFYGSAVAVPVKMLRAFSVFPGARVALMRIYTQWFCMGVIYKLGEADIVAGIPGAARIEFGATEAEMRVYDENGLLVSEMTPDIGFNVYDAEGAAGNYVRLRAEIGQQVLSQKVDGAAGYTVTRLATYKTNPGAATERIETILECGRPPNADTSASARITLDSQRDDDSEGPRISITANSETDQVPPSEVFISGNVVKLWGQGAATDRVEFLFADLLLGQYPGCKLYRSGAFSGTNDTWTLLDWDAEAYDDDAMHSTGTNPSRVDIPYTGKYEVAVSVTVNHNSTTQVGSRECQVRVNSAGSTASGSLLRHILVAPNPHSGGRASTMELRLEKNLVAGDYVEVFWKQAHGATLNGLAGEAYTYITVKRVIL